MKTCMSRPSAGHRGAVVATYDIIQVYKTLVLSCGISLEGNCEDPKVREITLIFIRICIQYINPHILLIMTKLIYIPLLTFYIMESDT